MIRAYHASRGEGGQRDEVITTIFSHPSNAAARRSPGTRSSRSTRTPTATRTSTRCGPPSRSGRPALLITNPEDTGHLQPADRGVRPRRPRGRRPLPPTTRRTPTASWAITRARDAGFDLCHFNLHKTFSTPHALRRPGRRRLRRDRGAGAVPAAARRSSSTATRYLPRRRPAALDREGPALVRRRPEPGPGLRLDHEPRRRGPPRGGRDRRPQQQLPHAKVLEIRGRRGAVRGRAAPDRAGPLQLGGARPRDRGPLRGDRLPGRGLRDALLD